jgi:hypothetical protein
MCRDTGAALFANVRLVHPQMGIQSVDALDYCYSSVASWSRLRRRWRGCSSGYSAAGRLLTASYPNSASERWICESKDHQSLDAGKLTVSQSASVGRSEFVVRRTHRALIGGSSFDLVRLPASTSFVAQRNHGIHTGGAAGWDVSGEHGDGQNSCWNHEV